MENFFKEKINRCVNYFKNDINSSENYKLVETKRKIFYYSKFSLETIEFYEIYSMVKSVKENVFKNLLDSIKYSTQGNILE